MVAQVPPCGSTLPRVPSGLPTQRGPLDTTEHTLFCGPHPPFWSLPPFVLFVSGDVSALKLLLNRLSDDYHMLGSRRFLLTR